MKKDGSVCIIEMCIRCFGKYGFRRKGFILGGGKAGGYIDSFLEEMGLSGVFRDKWVGGI